MKNYINLRKKKEPHRTCGVRVMRLVYIKIVYLKTLTLYYQTKKKKKNFWYSGLEGNSTRVFI